MIRRRKRSSLNNKKSKVLFNALAHLFIKYEVSTHLITSTFKSELIDLWKKKFQTTSFNKHDALWHTFSFNYVDHFKGDKAIEAFENLYFKDFTIFSPSGFEAIHCSANLTFSTYLEIINALAKLPFLTDIFVSHSNFNWTFVITHEEGFGPYFAYASSVVFRGK